MAGTTKPGLPQGTRDFGPEVVRKRNYILTAIRNVFELYGFQPLETPAIENLDTLIGKYGDEGDKLIFRVLNNGLDNPGKREVIETEFRKIIEGRQSEAIASRALRYDLTIPFARYVAANAARLTMPFKRYQMQAVWRADRPQKGRYREFWQCDADVVGSRSILNEAELASIAHQVMNSINLKGYRLHVNNRKVLKGIMQVCGLEELERSILIIIDKADKIGKDAVVAELRGLGIADESLEKLSHTFFAAGENQERTDILKTFLQQSAVGMEGIVEIERMLNLLQGQRVFTGGHVIIDTGLARGLEYYTGMIFEIKAPGEVKIGSIGGGGRYDELTALFGEPGIGGAGISFGVDRIYDVLEELNLFPEEIMSGTEALFFNLGEEEMQHAFRLVQQLRSEGISCELYHKTAKFDKQFKYAERKNIPRVIIIGSKEVEEKSCMVKDLRTGVQEKVQWVDLSSKIRDKDSKG